jgi:CheY-like chemotaxis protein
MREEDLQLLITLDDPWNAQECDIFYNPQAAHTVTYRPGQPYPTMGRHEHRAEDIIDIIIITAHGAGKARAEALAAGAVAFLHKPLKDEALLGAISSALSLDRRV